MITNSINKYLRASLFGCAICVAVTACTDTWDDHYEGTIGGVNEGSLWQAIENDANLSNFASVIKATGYDLSLGSSQVFTVFAPTNSNFSKAEADALISQYIEEKKTVNDDDNTVVKEFVKNHIALFNHSVSSLTNDTIKLMNGKYAFLSTGSLDNTNFTTSNMIYENGVLYTMESPIEFSANIFEQFRKDADLDSVRSFLYNPLFYRKKFDPSSSIEGGLDELGRTVYLDSVWRQQNVLYSYIGGIASEDSTYWMIAPTNKVWRELLEKYEPYFNYANDIDNLLQEGDRDSLVYTNTRLAIMEGTAFSKTINEEIISRQKTKPDPFDSIMSYNVPYSYAMRSYLWGANFNYYQYFGPLLPETGVLAEPDSVKCSNGLLLKTDNWKIDEKETFNHWIIVEAEGSSSVEIEKFAKSINKQTNDTIWEFSANAKYLSVDNDNYKGKVWSNSLVSFEDNNTDPIVWFNIPNVLSNMGYDIYLVSVPQEAADSTAENLKTRFNAYIYWKNADGTEKYQQVPKKAAVETGGKTMEYIQLAENFTFPVSTYGIEESKPSVRLRLASAVPQSMINRGTHTKTMNFDCLLVVPHGTLQFDEIDGVPVMLAFPHGRYDNKPYKYWIMRR
ncbi:MAG: fasciclin domain-containing protein [Prevotella sp.]|nr:fasciclin domain-containing protein [Prevotella sp.]